MLATAFTRLSVGRVAPTLVKGTLTRCALRQPVPQNVRALASEAIPTEPKPPRKPRVAKPKTANATTKTLGQKKAPKAAAPAKAKKPKKEVVKAKPWEARGPDGKLLPLPSATKPKKTSAYFLYLQSRIPDLIQDPSMVREGTTDKIDVTKLAKAAGAEWKAMSDSEKQPFEEDAQKGKAIYEEKLAEWRNNLTPEDIRRQNAYLRDQAKKGKSGMGRLRDPSKPKHPVTSFMLFLKEFRESRGSESMISTAKDGGAEWSNMSPEQKQPYVEKAEAEKASYTDAIKNYMSSQS